jgi:hypothetical protein
VYVGNALLNFKDSSFIVHYQHTQVDKQ